MKPLKLIALLAAFAVALVLTLSLVGCTDNDRARNYGGTSTINLKPGARVVNVTWKDVDLWILTKQDTTKPTSYSFKEKSSLGILEGEIIINEQ